LNSANSFDGAGSSTQSNALTGEFTVTVAQRLSNGNLMVRGEKWLTINQGQELIRISGIVRAEDIEQDNSVDSTRVADARITYTGRGTLNSANTARLAGEDSLIPSGCLTDELPLRGEGWGEGTTSRTTPFSEYNVCSFFIAKKMSWEARPAPHPNPLPGGERE
jgi:hypothetical protein